MLSTSNKMLVTFFLLIGSTVLTINASTAQEAYEDDRPLPLVLFFSDPDLTRREEAKPPLSPQAQYERSLITAARNQQLGIMQKLLTTQTATSASSDTFTLLLKIACQKNNTEMVTLLLRFSPSIDAALRADVEAVLAAADLAIVDE